MNDFTKEELQRIETAVSFYCIEIETDNSLKYLALTKKVQSMVDNYCDHEWTYHFGCSSIICHKCKKET